MQFKNGKNFKCKVCGKEFYRSLSKIKRGVTKYCSQKCCGLDRVGSKNFNWKGGRSIDKSTGYVRVKIGRNEWKYEHRLIMEKYLGRGLTSKEEMHHINGIKTDNRIENLELYKRKSVHQRIYHPSRYRKIQLKEYEKIMDLWIKGYSMRKIGKIFKVCHKTISLIIRRCTH